MRFGQLTRMLVSSPIWLAVLLFAPSAQADSAVAEKVLDLLYPQSATWTRLGSLPHAPASILDAPAEIEMLGDTEALREHPGCSPMLRMFVGNHAIDRLHRGNLFGTGDHDLIYAGDAPCGEGPWVVIWRNGLSTQGHRASIVLGGGLWRVLPGVELKGAGVSPGCCADPWSYYCLADPVPHETCTAAPSGLVLPDTAKKERRVVVLSRAVALQVEPNAAETHFDGDPYEPPHIVTGTRAEQLLVFADSTARIWRLVRVESRVLQYSIDIDGHVNGPTHLLGWAGD